MLCCKWCTSHIVVNQFKRNYANSEEGIRPTKRRACVYVLYGFKRYKDIVWHLFMNLKGEWKRVRDWMRGAGELWQLSWGHQRKYLQLCVYMFGLLGYIVCCRRWILLFRNIWDSFVVLLEMSNVCAWLVWVILRVTISTNEYGRLYLFGNIRRNNVNETWVNWNAILTLFVCWITTKCEMW